MENNIFTVKEIHDDHARHQKYPVFLGNAFTEDEAEKQIRERCANLLASGYKIKSHGSGFTATFFHPDTLQVRHYINVIKKPTPTKFLPQAPTPTPTPTPKMATIVTLIPRQDDSEYIRTPVRRARVV